MTPDIFGLIALAVTLCVHLISTVWWAASLTRRVEHIEEWIARHNRLAERIAALEASLAAAREGIERIEQRLRY